MFKITQNNPYRFNFTIDNNHYSITTQWDDDCSMWQQLKCKETQSITWLNSDYIDDILYKCQKNRWHYGIIYHQLYDMEVLEELLRKELKKSHIRKDG